MVREGRATSSRTSESAHDDKRRRVLRWPGWLCCKARTHNNKPPPHPPTSRMLRHPRDVTYHAQACPPRRAAPYETAQRFTFRASSSAASNGSACIRVNCPLPSQCLRLHIPFRDSRRLLRVPAALACIQTPHCEPPSDRTAPQPVAPPHRARGRSLPATV